MPRTSPARGTGIGRSFSVTFRSTRSFSAGLKPSISVSIAEMMASERASLGRPFSGAEARGNTFVLGMPRVCHEHSLESSRTNQALDTG